MFIMGRRSRLACSTSRKAVSPQVRHIIEKAVRKIVFLLAGSEAETERLLSERAQLLEHDCYKEAVTHFRTHCFNWHSSTVRGRDPAPEP